jgi:endonuclease/exonuclease/phosphatase (EEP) superfamily protein YafD
MVAGKIVWTTSIGLAAATLLAQLDRLRLGEIGWLFDLASHFPRQLGGLALLSMLAAAFFRRWPAAGLSAIVLLINTASFMRPSPFDTAGTARAGAAMLHVVTANVHESREALEKLARLAATYEADLVSTSETPELTDDEVQRLFPGFAATTVIARKPDGSPMSSRLLIASRTGAVKVAVVPIGQHHRAFLRYEVSIGDKVVQIVAAHTVAPGRPDMLADRNLELRALGEGLDVTQPFIIMGDFNASPWSSAMRLAPGVRAGDPRLSSTFPSVAPWLGAPIDHVMFGGGLILAEEHVGAAIGSDHRPVFAAFALPIPPKPLPSRALTASPTPSPSATPPSPSPTPSQAPKPAPSPTRR